MGTVECDMSGKMRFDKCVHNCKGICTKDPLHIKLNTPWLQGQCDDFESEPLQGIETSWNLKVTRFLS